MKKLLLNRFILRFLIICILIVALAPFIVAFYQWLTFGRWLDWTGFGEFTAPSQEYQRSKTLWDFMQLLIVPSALAITAILFNQSERKIEREIEEGRTKANTEFEAERQQEFSLQSYLDKVTDLIRSGELLDPTNESTRAIARVRTLTVLRGLDGVRKGLIIRFLYESKLIKSRPILDLREAILIGADLKDSILSKVALNQVNLSFSKLSGANLQAASLMETNLLQADLREADLHKADLTGADLTGADLTDADLSSTILTSANLLNAKVTLEQLSKCKSIQGATLPNGDIQE